MLPIQDPTTFTPAFNSQNPATWLKPDEPLIGADGRDWSWCYVWFKDAPDFVGYRVGFDGSAWCCKRRCTGQLTSEWKRLKLSPAKERGGYLYVTFQDNGRIKRFRIHKLVMETFWGPCPPGMECCHGDDDPTHNHFDNLKWGTPLENARQKVERDRNVRGTRHWKAKLTPELIPQILEYRRSGATLPMVAERFNLSETQAGRVCRGESWRREFKDATGSIPRQCGSVAGDI